MPSPGPTNAPAGQGELSRCLWFGCVDRQMDNGCEPVLRGRDSRQTGPQSSGAVGSPGVGGGDCDDCQVWERHPDRNDVCSSGRPGPGDCAGPLSFLLGSPAQALREVVGAGCSLSLRLQQRTCCCRRLCTRAQEHGPDTASVSPSSFLCAGPTVVARGAVSRTQRGDVGRSWVHGGPARGWCVIADGNASPLSLLNSVRRPLCAWQPSWTCT